MVLCEPRNPYTAQVALFHNFSTIFHWRVIRTSNNSTFSIFLTQLNFLPDGIMFCNIYVIVYVLVLDEVEETYDTKRIKWIVLE